MIYFDSAATTLQKPRAVGEAVLQALSTVTTPGRGDYPPSRRAAELMLQLRTEAAQLLGVSSPERVILTHNATHGLNLAIKSLVKPGSRVVISGYEHNAVTRPLRAIGNVAVKVVNAPLFATEQMVEGFRAALTGGEAAAICTHVSNVFGYELPVAEIAALCREKGVPLVVDASQSAGILPVETDGWGAAFVALPGHKGLYGPQGTGILLCGEGRMPADLLQGGTGSLSRQQEMPDFLPDRLEAGTPNVPGVAGLLEGLRFVSAVGVEKIGRHERELIGKIGGLLARIEGMRVYRAGDPGCQSGVLSFTVDGMDCERVGEWLSDRGVAVRAGLHCAPMAHESAGTLATGTVRVSVSAFNNIREMERAAAILSQLPRKK